MTVGEETVSLPTFFVVMIFIADYVPEFFD